MLSMSEILTLHLGDYVNPAGGVINSFAIRHPEGVVLVDTGPGWDHEKINAVYAPGRRTLEAALNENGIGLSEVALVINNHLHWDHCGGNQFLDRIPIYVQADEHAAAEGPGFVRAWVNFPDARYELLEGESEIVPGIRALPSPAHTAGTQAVVVDTQEGLVLIAAQSIQSAADYEQIRTTGKSLTDSQLGTATYLASAQRLIDLRPRRVLFSHDPTAWEAAD